MKKLIVANLFILFSAGLLTPAVAEHNNLNFIGNQKVEVQGLSTIEANSGTSNNFYLNEWRNSVNSVPDLSIYDYKVTRSSFVSPNVADFIQTAALYESGDLVVNGPPDPKKKNPINIDSSKDLRKFPGSGSVDDPYIIEGFIFENSRKNLIQIQYTDVYIIVRNNVFNGLNSGNVNVLINNAQHVTVESNEMSSNDYSVMVSNSFDININSNSISNTVNDGILLENVDSFSVSSNNVTQTSNGIVINNSSDGIVSNNLVFSNSGIGMTLAYSTDILVSRNTIHSNNGDGLFFLDSSSNTVMSNNIYNNGLGSEAATNSVGPLSVSATGTLIINGFGGSGFFIDPSDDNLILNNNITDNAGIGLYLQDSQNVIIDGNDLSSNGLNGLFLEDSHNNTINDNDIKFNGYSTGLEAMGLNFWESIVYAGFGGSGFFIDPSDGNTVTNNDISGNSANGLTLQSSSYTDISSNTIDDNGLNGVFFVDSSNNDITDNQITNNGGTGSALAVMSANSPFDQILLTGFGGSGFFIDPSYNNTIDGNMLSGNTGSGLVLMDSEDNDVVDNQILSNGGDGVLVTNSSHNNFESNEVSSNGGSSSAILASFELNEDNLRVMGFGGSGFFIDPSDDITITDNFVTNNAGSGIFFLDIDDGEISNNTISTNGLDGITFQNSDGNNVTENVIEYNGFTALTLTANSLSTNGFGGSGFFIDPSAFNSVTRNNFTGNAGYGFFSEASTHTEFAENRVLDHPLYGVILDDTSGNSLVIKNNFQANNPGGLQAADNGAGNIFTANFWADHDNNDTNFDGIADEPYPVDGNAENTDYTASNIPNGLNFYNATMQSSPRVLNAESEGTPITLKVYLSDGFRALSIELDKLWLNETINPYTSHIIDIQTFTVTFDRLAVNDLVNSLGLTPPFFVDLELTGIMNDGLLDITAHDFVEINQAEENQLLGFLPIAGSIGLIPILNNKKRKDDKTK